jgi:hypothetical protein
VEGHVGCGAVGQLPEAHLCTHVSGHSTHIQCPAPGFCVSVASPAVLLAVCADLRPQCSPHPNTRPDQTPATDAPTPPNNTQQPRLLSPATTSTPTRLTWRTMLCAVAGTRTDCAPTEAMPEPGRMSILTCRQYSPCRQDRRRQTACGKSDVKIWRSAPCRCCVGLPVRCTHREPMRQADSSPTEHACWAGNGPTRGYGPFPHRA